MLFHRFLLLIILIASRPPASTVSRKEYNVSAPDIHFSEANKFNTQQTTASAEESASASEELASQAELLKRTVSEFNLGSMEANSLHSSGNQVGRRFSREGEFE
ncbi:MAG: hypothetical protein ACLFP4_08085 [Spirochaetales bacterium]